MRTLADNNYVNYLKSTSSKTDQEQAKTLSGAEQLDTKPEWWDRKKVTEMTIQTPFQCEHGDSQQICSESHGLR